MKTLFKGILPLLLALSLVFGLQSVALASNTALNGIGYIGDVNNCKMSAGMAEAYAAKLLGDDYDGMAILLDPAGDGMPLMMTYGEGDFYLWAWDGTRAYSYLIEEDADTSYLSNYFTGTYQGHGALCVIDGLDSDDPSPYGALIYTVSNGNLHLAHRHTSYYAKAFDFDPSSAYGASLPLVPIMSNNTVTGEASAAVSDLLNAGYVATGDNYYVLTKIDNNYLRFTDFNQLDSWYNNHESSCFKVGESILSSPKWSDAIAMRQALTNYANAAMTQPTTFVDVPSYHYAYSPVQWAVDIGITVGTSATTFSPDMTCSDAHILTFLWRAMNEPEPSIANPFSTISPKDYYYKAVLWAVENDLIDKYTPYNPNRPCTRAMAVRYFWALNGYPSSSGATFSDVDPGSAYAGAVSWAVDQGVTYGTSTTTFSPNETCTRAQIVSFLYRLVH